MSHKDWENGIRRNEKVREVSRDERKMERIDEDETEESTATLQGERYDQQKI